jgi:hypothetical protein
LDLKTELVVETGEQERELVLERVKMLGRSGAQVRRLDEETFGDVAAFAEPVEDDEVSQEITVRGRLKHGLGKSGQFGLGFFWPTTA